ncbi:c-type cytochrome [Nesterenkonia lutea]|uniref:Cytochrome c1 n=1 Tax=Nesterenkonia lutea TaxID=272919 RepID=A0ABR9JCB8_9MICC|nr:c-type cytochrome [Nesterenkonia lutea]MBE1523451.1 cytochrome c1 [Nesterenkonia lutea]
MTCESPLARTAAMILALAGTAVLSACGTAEEAEPRPVPGGDPEAGRAAILEYGCASCHVIDDVDSVASSFGPDLTDFGEELYIAGQLPNRPEELIRWIQTPQEIQPGTAMPNMGVTEQDARDIAAFLYDQ